MEVYLNQMKGIRPKSLREKQLEAVGRALSLLSICSAVVVVLIDIPFLKCQRDARRLRGKERFQDKKRKLDEFSAAEKDGAATEVKKARTESHTSEEKAKKQQAESSSSSSSSSSSESSSSESEDESHDGDKNREEKESKKDKKKRRKMKEKEREAKKRKEKEKKARKQENAAKKEADAEAEIAKKEKLDKLREDRLRREREEREKLSKFEKDLGTPLDIYRHRYYSQFNPKFAKPSFTPNRQ